DRWHSRVSWASEEAIFSAAQHTHTPLDYMYIDHADLDALKQYSVLFYPHPSIMTKAREALLRAYVEQGGTVVFGCRSAYKDVNGQCVMEKLPGLLADLTASDIPE
ncbi:MAG: beta-galactosidase trimerization domain-containing protein, partial [Clostridia bacterium]|nr:beta-galactosidase trimerization domain-containing protein [Clostridia bacterium]